MVVLGMRGVSSAAFLGACGSPVAGPFPPLPRAPPRFASGGARVSRPARAFRSLSRERVEVEQTVGVHPSADVEREEERRELGVRAHAQRGVEPGLEAGVERHRPRRAAVGAHAPRDARQPARRAPGPRLHHHRLAGRLAPAPARQRGHAHVRARAHRRPERGGRAPVRPRGRVLRAEHQRRRVDRRAGKRRQKRRRRAHHAARRVRPTLGKGKKGKGDRGKGKGGGASEREEMGKGGGASE